jgi:hypothetical protein
MLCAGYARAVMPFQASFENVLTLNLMLKAGCIVLSCWALLNLVLALSVVVSTVLFNGDSPAIYQILEDSEVEALSAKERTSINSMAAYANGLNSAFSLTVLFVIWFALRQRLVWAFWCLLFGFGTALTAGIAGDSVLGIVHTEVNIISTLILILGFVLTAIGLFYRPHPTETIS